jgi:RecJ-like exonuclease
MTAALNRLGAKTHVRPIEGLDDNVLSHIEEVESNLIVFTDIGSGYLNEIAKTLKGREVVIADHHQPLGDVTENIHHFNTHTLGFNGSEEISGAGTAYLLAKSIDPKNKDLSALAIVGCLGDQQDKGPIRTLQGLNLEILSDATNSGVISVAKDLILFGRETRPIHKAIASTTSPFLPSLSGEEDRCLALLDAANIPTKVEDRWRTISDLSIEEKRRLVDKIVETIISRNLDGQIALELIGTVYTLTHEEPSTPLRDAREYASFLNSCGRMGRSSLGIALNLGDKGKAFDEAQEVYMEYKKFLSKYMNWVSSDVKAVTKTPYVAIVKGDGVIDDSMTGAVSSLLSSSGIFGPSKVIVVTTNTRTGQAKLSTRGTEELVQKGVNLGLILQELSSKYGGNGGGHAIAAGATTGLHERDNFLSDFIGAVEKVLHA